MNFNMFPYVSTVDPCIVVTRQAVPNTIILLIKLPHFDVNFFRGHWFYIILRNMIWCYCSAILLLLQRGSWTHPVNSLIFRWLNILLFLFKYSILFSINIKVSWFLIVLVLLVTQQPFNFQLLSTFKETVKPFKKSYSPDTSAALQPLVGPSRV